MFKKANFYYFSPTGGTKKAGNILAQAIAEEINFIDLGAKTPINESPCDISIIALPVFAGRIPSFTCEKVKSLNGADKKIVTMVVYGVRAYDDALLELNDAAKEAGFQVIASAAVVAQHSMAAFVGAGRPDEKDDAEIKDFALNILKKANEATTSAINVPGNKPYRDIAQFPVSPVCTDECKGCGLCIKTCPVDAITKNDGKISTDIEKCILCLACTSVCQKGARVLPKPFSDGIAAKMAPLKEIARANEFYL